MDVRLVPGVHLDQHSIDGLVHREIRRAGDAGHARDRHGFDELVHPEMGATDFLLGGFFDFTYDRTEGTEHHVLHEDFYYRTETLIALAAKHGLEARFMDDWEQTGHPQSKIRVTLPVPPGSGPCAESG